MNDYVGKVCVCSLGRAGVVTGRKNIDYGNGFKPMWTGIGFDGRGLWASSSPTVIAETLEEYVQRVACRPNNVLYGQIAVPSLPQDEKSACSV